MQKGQLLCIGRVEEIPPGRAARIPLSDGSELAVFNVNGEFYATVANCRLPIADCRLEKIADSL